MNDEKRAELLEAVTDIMVDDGLSIYDAGRKIIDLVDADVQRQLAGERKRIRDALLDPVMFNEAFIGRLAVILDLVGITEESTR